MAVLVIVVVAVHARRLQLSCQIICHCLIRIAGYTGAHFDSGLCQSRLCTAAHAAAKQHVDVVILQHACQRLVSGTVGTHHFTGTHFAVFHLIHLERFGMSKMLEYGSVILIVCYCNFHVPLPSFS